MKAIEWTIRAAAIAALVSLLALGTALFSLADAAEYRTVQWYADHPYELSGVLTLCRNNAGLARANPNCINADEAQILVTQRELNQAGGLGSPFSPRYWNAHPNDKRQQLWACNMMVQQKAVIDPTTRRICGAVRAGG